MRTIAILLIASSLGAAELISGRDAGGFTDGASVLRGISDDASAVIYESDGQPVLPPGWIFPPATGIYLRDRLFFTTRLVVPYDDRPVGSAHAALSGDGRAVAYVAWSDPRIGVGQVRVVTLATGADTVVSTSSFGVAGDRASSAPAISGDGRAVAFVSEADDLTADGLPGTFVADVFVKDRVTGATTCASLTPDGHADTGTCALPAISRNGRWVAFYSDSTALVPGIATPASGSAVFARDLVAGTTVRVDLSSAGAPADAPPYAVYPPAISADGRYVAFASPATNLAAGDVAGRVDVFVRDLRDGVTTCVSRAIGGGEADDASLEPSLSLDGRYVAFRSYASDLVAGDSNGAVDVFVRDRTAATTIRVDAGWLGAPANGDAYAGTRICGLGFAVAYTSLASNLVLGDPNGKTDVFLNANDPRTAASTAARLYLATLQAWVRTHLPILLRLRANG